MLKRIIKLNKDRGQDQSLLIGKLNFKRGEEAGLNQQKRKKI